MQRVASKANVAAAPTPRVLNLLRRLRPRLITAKQHPHDGRKITVTLTPQRLDIVRQVRARNREILASSVSIGPEERRRLDELVTLIINIPHAQALNHLGGKARAKCLSEAEIAKTASKGGLARATKLSAAERGRIAKLAVAAREGQRKGEK